MIRKTTVERQAAFIFISLRQSILNFLSRYAREIVNIADVREAKEVLTRAAHEFLTELAGFPERMSDLGWLETLETAGEAQPAAEPRVRPASGVEIAERAKTEARRKRKAETIRKLRAKG